MDWGFGSSMLNMWNNLTSPLGLVLLIPVLIYIFLRVTGRIDGISLGRGNNNAGQSRKPDYIIK